MSLNINGLDVNNGLANVGYDEEIYRLVLIAFVEEGKDTIDLLLKSKETDISKFVVYAHAMKSACNNIGALDLGERAKLLEFAGKDNDLDYINSTINAFISDLKILISELEEYLE